MKKKKRSQLQERNLAALLGGKQVIASGALWNNKGDVRTDHFLIECKYTKKRYYSLTDSTWNKIKKEAIKDGLREPAMCIDLYVNEGIHVVRKMVLPFFTAIDFSRDSNLLFADCIFIEGKSFRIYDSTVGSFRGPNFPDGIIVMNWGDFSNIIDSI